MTLEDSNATWWYWATRAVHWILARMGLFQTVLLFMWLSERAQLNRTPPIEPWIIFVHAAVGMIGSTGLSARFLARASLYALTAIQLHLGYLYAFQSTLAYPRWLRARVALRSLASAAIYLRILGIKQSNPSVSSEFVHKNTTSQYTLGVSLLSVFTALTGLLSLPTNLIHIDRETQLIEHSSTWPLFVCLEPFVSFSLCIGFCVASVLYAFPLLITRSAVPTHDHRTDQLLFRLADWLTLSSLTVQLFFRDSNSSYWTKNGSEFWLHSHLLLNTFIIFAGVLVTMDIFKASEHCPREPPVRLKTD
ncbi:hypothetical protein CLF_112001 [Clonorchis sinensis]|uniref:Uncharacterized protein n=1 Tax=Clonorchis sinensis TaxID=79923 RepID=G7YVN5_CLOSI|nr:hypothetical protein CLF_112001 [Clonorchis sinensis]